jgi:hypothetical protein
MRSWKRRSCSSSLTENQYFTRMIPERISMRSNSGHDRRNSSYSSSRAEPHDPLDAGPVVPGLRSNSTISPAAGSSAT